jgi:DNA-binding transcriptional LysR family regulator
MKNPLDLWAGLDLRHLVAFQAVAETGSFARASERLGYTQPAISHQVATLERIVGQRLFERSSGRSSVTPTEAGRLFAVHLDALTSRLGSARADLDALSAGETGVVRIGAFQSMSARIVPELFQRLAAGDHGISIELTESAEEAELLARLDRGDLDFAFTLLPLDDDRFATIELLHDPYYVAGPAGGAYRLEIDSLRDIGDTPIIAPRTCRSWTAIVEQLRAAGVEPKYAFRTDDNFALKGLIQGGVGIAFITRLTLDMMGDDLEVFPVAGLVAPRRIALTWSRQRALLPLGEVFISLALEACNAIAPLDSDGAPQVAITPR